MHNIRYASLIYYVINIISPQEYVNEQVRAGDRIIELFINTTIYRY